MRALMITYGFLLFASNPASLPGDVSAGAGVDAGVAGSPGEVSAWEVIVEEVSTVRRLWEAR